MTADEKIAWATIYAAVWAALKAEGGWGKTEMRRLAMEEADFAVGRIQRA